MLSVCSPPSLKDPPSLTKGLPRGWQSLARQSWAGGQNMGLSKVGLRRCWVAIQSQDHGWAWLRGWHEKKLPQRPRGVSLAIEPSVVSPRFPMCDWNDSRSVLPPRERCLCSSWSHRRMIRMGASCWSLSVALSPPACPLRYHFALPWPWTLAQPRSLSFLSAARILSLALSRVSEWGYSLARLCALL